MPPPQRCRRRCARALRAYAYSRGALHNHAADSHDWRAAAPAPLPPTPSVGRVRADGGAPALGALTTWGLARAVARRPAGAALCVEAAALATAAAGTAAVTAVALAAAVAGALPAVGDRCC
ncbi:hypothetical protein Rsub_04209 [Raphidocelis subcapitata]|uniref:Uncharacterized protein n=1 Tax=Raphidocelis subcapitata TaxID=307507 RepID=A0A2V0NVX1_9CHLO|nr:hypothetical protein Rsub_04209 [Raphidocelis subcapitata]|eukprot:GBF91469.1 hypothetical protein Rsub_04209 [Raphidocelis subcapitata]